MCEWDCVSLSRYVCFQPKNIDGVHLPHSCRCLYPCELRKCTMHVHLMGRMTFEKQTILASVSVVYIGLFLVSPFGSREKSKANNVAFHRLELIFKHRDLNVRISISPSKLKIFTELLCKYRPSFSFSLLLGPFVGWPGHTFVRHTFTHQNHLPRTR